MGEWNQEKKERVASQKTKAGAGSVTYSYQIRSSLSLKTDLKERKMPNKAQL